MTTATTTTATTTTRSSTGSKMKDVLKMIQQTYEQEAEVVYHNLLEVLKGKPFWIWNYDHDNHLVPPNSQCCFNHIIGLPQKDNHDNPLVPYQRMLHELLEQHKQIWIKKSRGIGVSTFLLRWVAYCCFNMFPANSRVGIIVGPRMELAIDLIDRFKALFDKIAPGLFDGSKSTEAIINHNITVSAFPSYHSQTLRGLDFLKMLVIDEGDYFPSFQQKEIRAVSEGYIGKPNSDPQIIIASTPKDPLGLMKQIEDEADSLYHKVFLDYRFGLEGPYPIYDKAQIELAQLSPEFGREYGGLYSGVVGNTFSMNSIQKAIELGDQYDIGPDSNFQNINRLAQHVIGIDPGFVHFGVTCLEFSDNIIKVVFSEQFDRSKTSSNDNENMVSKIMEIKNAVGNVTCINIDGANAEFIDQVKRRLGENHNWHYIHDLMARCKREGFELNNYMTVCPVNFNEDSRFMLQHLRHLLDHGGVLAINSGWDKLLVGMKSTVSEEYKMDKSQPFNDLVDSMRLACKFFELNDDNGVN